MCSFLNQWNLQNVCNQKISVQYGLLNSTQFSNTDNIISLADGIRTSLGQGHPVQEQNRSSGSEEWQLSKRDDMAKRRPFHVKSIGSGVFGGSCRTAFHYRHVITCHSTLYLLKLYLTLCIGSLFGIVSLVGSTTFLPAISTDIPKLVLNLDA